VVVLIKTFIIQTINGEVTHDFSFHLLEAIKYNNWYQNEKIYHYILTNDLGCYKTDKDNIPVGSVEFILNALKYNCGIEKIKPLNVPLELMKPEYLKRWVKIVKTNSIVTNTGDESIFVKDNTKIKGICDIIPENYSYPIGEWLVSEVVDIESEWRAFVFNDKLVGLQNYSGDFTLFPDVKLIKEMINEYKGINPCYTLDVGVNYSKGTFILESHDFFSCGLYGFSDYRILPKMFIATWNKLIN
jgi:hypothetical protein